MKKAFWFFLYLALSLSVPAHAADLTSATCRGAGSTGCVMIGVGTSGTVGVQITGTFSATIQFEQSIDNVTWVAWPVTDPNGDGSSVTSTTAAGYWIGSAAGAKTLRVRVSAYTSGTASVFYAQTQAKTGGSGGGGSVPADLVADSLCLNAANHDACFVYGPSFLTGGAGGSANTVRLENGSVPQELWISGVAGTAADSMFGLHLVSPTGAGGFGKVLARRGDILGNVNLQLGSDEGGVVVLGNEDTGVLVVSAQTDSGIVSKGTSIREDSCYGFAHSVLGAPNDPVSVCMAYALDGLIKIQHDSTGGADGSIRTALFSSTASEVIASAATIAPTHSFFHVSGTAAVVTITVPAQCPATCSITIIADGAFTTTTAGNIKEALTAVANKAMEFVWDGSKWFVKHGY